MPTAGSSMREMMFGRLGRAPEKPKRR